MQRALRSLILLVAAAVATAVPLRGTFTLAADAALADDDALNAVVAAASVVTPPVHDLTPGELLIVRDQRLTRKNGPQFWHGDMQDCCVNEHGWQTACGQSEGCTLQSTAQLADKGALSEALPSASAAHVLAAARDATRRFYGSGLADALSPPLSTHILDYKGKVLRVRTPIHDGFWVRALFTVALGSWASLSGIPTCTHSRSITNQYQPISIVA